MRFAAAHTDPENAGSGAVTAPGERWGRGALTTWRRRGAAGFQRLPWGHEALGARGPGGTRP
eukprot:4658428-Lingulodinium_polyedra.AAC.1